MQAVGHSRGRSAQRCDAAIVRAGAKRDDAAILWAVA